MNQENTCPAEVLQIRQILEQHNRWRGRTLNLIASENVLSPRVRELLDSDLLGRYCDYTGRDLEARRYRGTRSVVEMEKLVESLALEVFGASFVELRPIAGHLAGAAVISALCKPGDVLLEIGPDGGGHREAAKLSLPSLIPLGVHFLPFDGHRYNVDLPAALEMIEEIKPHMVILGSSNFLFPHPVKDIKKAMKRSRRGSILVYDASHVMGFLAVRRFQNPLEEGADVVFGSTHKTFPGPQGGIIFSDREALMQAISEAVYPGLVTNHHGFRMPALGMALMEMRAFGPAYMDQVNHNAQALGEALEFEQIPCVYVDGRYSQSHTVLMKVAAFGKGSEIALGLEKADIITTAASLPKEQGKEGIRIGVQEITRLGAREKDMTGVAKLLAMAVRNELSPERIASEVHEFTDGLGPVLFTW